MQVDPEYLRQHYNLLSDEALLSIDRSDLVEVAQKCYDAELARRGLTPLHGAGRIEESRPFTGKRGGSTFEEAELEVEPGAMEERPDWLDEAAEVYSRDSVAGTVPASDMADARGALEAAGIPCHLELSEIPEEESAGPRITHQWRLMVPGHLNLPATSVLERDMFNQEFEAGWREYLETLSDDELSVMTLQSALCGLFDRVERATRAYNEEIARRELSAATRIGTHN
jgi:hypothetical protein